MKLHKLKSTFLAVLFLLFALFTCSSFPNISAVADNAFADNGKYKVPISIQIKMGADNFSDYVFVEKLDDIYYMSFFQLNPSICENMSLDLYDDKEVGCMVDMVGDSKRFIYSLGYDDLLKSLNFSITITAAGWPINTTFSITLHLDEASFLSSSIDDLGDRPARFIPKINVNASDSEMEKGSTYFIPSATAVLGNLSLDVDVSAFYMNDDVRVPVDISNNRLVLSNIGFYHIIFYSNSDKYLTSQGNPTSKTIDITITSKIGASVLAKIDDINNVLPDDYMISANLISSGDSFLLAENNMKDIADNFIVINVNIFSPSGQQIVPTDNINLFLRADDYFDRQKLICYFCDSEGNLTLIDNQNYGRYAMIQTASIGNFIICVPGVAHHLPMWAIACIIVLVCLVIIAIIVTTIILVIKHKKKQKLN